MKKKSKRIQVEEGSGNVFRDLGFPNAEREQFKADLILQIFRLITARDLKQAEAGKIIGIKQPHVSALMRGHSGAFSVEWLMRFLTALGQDVEITLRPRGKRAEHGGMSVVVR
jgi:predicted XRE-type DNA-binding protein